MTYPVQCRRHVLSVRARENLSISETAKRFNIGTASLTRWIQDISPIKFRNRRARKIPEEELLQDIRDNPDDYLSERAERFGVSPTGIFKALRRLGISHKKNLVSSQGG